MSGSTRSRIAWPFRILLAAVALAVITVVALLGWYVLGHRTEIIGRVANDKYEIITERFPGGFGTSQFIKVIAVNQQGQEQLMLIADAYDTVDVRFLDSNTAELYLLDRHASYPNEWYVRDTFTYQLNQIYDPVRLD